MSKPDKSIDPRILQSAREEFLEKGYEKASTNAICKNAGVTTGALFKRYKNKDELFCALVSDTAEEFRQMLKKQYAAFHELSQEEQLVQAVEEKEHVEPMEFVYSNLEDFKLLLACAEGSSYENYKDEITDIITEATSRFMLNTDRKPMLGGSEVSAETLRFLVGMQQHALFEIILKDTSYEDACAHARQIQHFFDIAWSGVFNLNQSS